MRIIWPKILRTELLSQPTTSVLKMDIWFGLYRQPRLKCQGVQFFWSDFECSDWIGIGHSPSGIGIYNELEINRPLKFRLFRPPDVENAPTPARMPFWRLRQLTTTQQGTFTKIFSTVTIHAHIFQSRFFLFKFSHQLRAKIYVSISTSSIS